MVPVGEKFLAGGLHISPGNGIPRPAGMFLFRDNKHFFFSLGSLQKDPAVPTVIGCIKPLKDDSGKDSKPQER